jgi:hypothetical protein
VESHKRRAVLIIANLDRLDRKVEKKKPGISS